MEKWTRGVRDPAGLSFIGVKGQIGIQLNVKRLDVATKVTLCAAGMSGVMSVDSILN